MSTLHRIFDCVVVFYSVKSFLIGEIITSIMAMHCRSIVMHHHDVRFIVIIRVTMCNAYITILISCVNGLVQS